MAAELPDSLAHFIENGGVMLHCEDGDWDLNILPTENSPFRNELPKRGVMIAENGCGDCLFLKRSRNGTVGKKVFVFWHEEDRCEKFAPDITVLLKKSPPPKADAARTDNAAPTKRVSLADFEKVVTDPQRGSYRTEVMKRFKVGGFGLEALPLLRKVLNYDDIFLVLEAAECVAKLGATAKEADDYGDLQNQLTIIGSKIWDYSGYANAYSACLDTLEKIQADKDLILSYVARNIGIESPDDLIASLRALQRIGNKDAKDLLKRAAAFRQPNLNLRWRKEVEKILKSAQPRRVLARRGRGRSSKTV